MLSDIAMLLQMQGVHALAQDLGSDVKTADREREAFMRALPGVKAWQARGTLLVARRQAMIDCPPLSEHTQLQIATVASTHCLHILG